MADFLVQFWQESSLREAGQKIPVWSKVVAGASIQAAVDAAVLDDQVHGPELGGTPVITAEIVYTKT